MRIGYYSREKKKGKIKEKKIAQRCMFGTSGEKKIKNQRRP
jgi:hypothetical protein